MGNYEQLKQSVSDVIKTNGNQEITGSILQNVLLTIISTVGANATFAGIATPATNPGTPDGPVFYLASESGTYSNLGGLELQDGLSVLMWNGSWSSQQILSIDDEPTAGSDNLVKSKGVQEELVLGAVYDVSAKNPTAGTNNDGKFESLSALLEDANLDTLIPVSVRKGGMSIKFVQSSDNKYVQFRLMARNFTTDVTQWAIADEGVYVDNPEFVAVWLDNSNHILFALEKNGNIIFATGIPKQIQDALTPLVTELGITKEETHQNSLRISLIDTTITAILKVIDYFSELTCEYLSATISQDGKLIEAVKEDGTKVISLIDKVTTFSTSIIGQDGECVAESMSNGSPEMIQVALDSDNRILYGIRLDGTFYISQLESPELQKIVSLIPSDDRIKEIAQSVVPVQSDDILSMYPDSKYLSRVAMLKKKTPYGYSPKNTPISFIWFSDIHGDVNNFRRINTWYEHYKSYIDGIINCGDTVDDNLGQLSKFDAMCEINNKVFTVLGNHDVNDNTHIYKGYGGLPTPANLYQMWTAKLNLESMGIVQPENAEENGYNFYYKDFTEGAVNCKPLRLIILDSTISPDSIRLSGTGADTSLAQSYVDAQLTWFTSILEDAKNKGFAVVACTHGLGRCATKIESDTMFTASGVTTVPGAGDYSAFLSSSIFDAVESFKEDGGEFICWLCGHEHYDCISKVVDYPEQLAIHINTATSRTYGESPTNPHRTGYNGTKPITDTTDDFNMIQFDTYNKIIRMVSIGNNYDMFGRTKDIIAIDYNTLTIKR